LRNMCWVCGDGYPTLAERFSQIEAHMVQQEMENAAKSGVKILPPIKKLIKDVELTVKISELFCQPTVNEGKIDANCHLRS